MMSSPLAWRAFASPMTSMTMKGSMALRFENARFRGLSLGGERSFT
jgi:hypothetical protein